MTSDVKLPPLPPRVPVDKHLPTGVVIYGYTNDMMRDYARDYAAAKDAEIEALRAEVERLQEIVRPKREDECLTLDHWRMRSYDLEANWSRCLRACAGEQTKREQAEARAEDRRTEAGQGGASKEGGAVDHGRPARSADAERGVRRALARRACACRRSRRHARGRRRAVPGHRRHPGPGHAHASRDRARPARHGAALRSLHPPDSSGHSTQLLPCANSNRARTR